MKILVLGITGMLGNAVLRVLSEYPGLAVYGTMRSEAGRKYFPDAWQTQLIAGVDVDNHAALAKVIAEIHPDAVINCVGVVKQLDAANDPLQAIPINALLPHRLAALCKTVSARLIHISTDCVFSGSKGHYTETDSPDAHDLYGRSKLLGEADYPHAITLRTSIIGHELGGHRSLLEWFLAQEGQVKGFTRAIFSGLPTVVLATIIRDIVLPRPALHGVYHVASQPISKFDLLRLVAEVYGKTITIIPTDELVIDRSLNADRFRQATGYASPEWPALIERMHQFGLTGKGGTENV